MMKTIATLFAGLLLTQPAMAWGEREQGALTGIVVWEVLKHIHNDRHQPTVQQSPVIVQQPPVIVHQQPTVIFQNTGVMCPQGTAAFYHQRYDRYGRIYYIFDGCR